MMKRNKRLAIFFVASVVLLLTALMGHARKDRQLTASPAKTFTMMVDSIDYRQDLTRVYCRVVGRPHTSNRFDKIVMVTKSGRFEATDIDGVDFSRWFQWEDDGVIDIEIDFQAMTPVSGGRFDISTPRGTEEIIFSK